MAKFSGIIGYGEVVEKALGVKEMAITERSCRGEVIENARRLVDDDKIINDISVENQISILADAYATKHFFAMQYISWSGTLWTVLSARVERPRIILRLGGVYNGPRPDSSGETP